MTALPKFGSVEKCVKCGASRAKVLGVEYVGAVSFTACGIDGITSTQVTKECLSITCPDCGYTWSEQCADAKKEGE